MNDQAPPIANKFGAFGRGGAPFNASPAIPYLDVDEYLKRVSPLSFLSLLADSQKRSLPRSSKPARSTSFLTPNQPTVRKGGCGT